MPISFVLRYVRAVIVPCMLLSSPGAGQSVPSGKPIMTDSVVTLSLSSPLPSYGQLGGVAVDRLGFIYVANFRDMLWKISPEGHVEELSRALYGSSGIAIDRVGDIFQSNFYANTITRITRAGDVSTYADTGLSGPVGIAVDDHGNLFVCNCSDNSIETIAPDRTVRTFASGKLFNCPNGITSDNEGNLFVVNFGNDHIVRITADGRASIFATVPGAEGNAHIAAMNSNLYVTKIKTNTVYKVTPNGEHILFAGTGQQGRLDGPALHATLSRPNGIAADPVKGILYVNTLNGEWTSNSPTSIDVRAIKLATLTDIFTTTLEQEGLEAAIESYRQFKNDPQHRFEDTGPETGTLGWQLMKNRKVTEAIAVFTLMAESYPERWRPQYYLGEVYKIIGQDTTAIDHYRRSLRINPDNPVVLQKLNELEAQ
jgi:hypothetical protein